MNVHKLMLGLILMAAPLAMRGVSSPVETYDDAEVVFCGKKSEPVRLTNEVIELATFGTFAEAEAYAADDAAIASAIKRAHDDVVNAWCIGCILPEDEGCEMKRRSNSFGGGLVVSGRPNADETHSVLVTVDDDEWFIECTKCEEIWF